MITPQPPMEKPEYWAGTFEVSCISRPSTSSGERLMRSSMNASLEKLLPST